MAPSENEGIHEPSGHRISTPQPDPGFFRATKVGLCSDIPSSMRLCRPGSSQVSCHNQTDPLPSSRWSIAAPERVAGAGLVRGLQRGADRPLKTNRAAPFSLGTCCTAQFSRNRKAIIPVPEAKLGGALMTQQDRRGSLFRLCGSSSRWACCSTLVSHEKAPSVGTSLCRV
jgi:hypothetical protein